MDRPGRVYGWVFIVYLLCAQLTSLLSLAPGSAAPVWPAAGVALAAVLLYGNGAAIAIFLAEFLFLWFTSEVDLAWFQVLFISTGGALQPLLGAWLVRRFAAFPNSLATFADVTRFLFWGGLVATLVGASVTTGMLWQQGFDAATPPLALTFYWLSWWVADAAGVCLVTPVLLAWLSPRVELWRPRRWSITGSTAVMLLLLVALVGVNRYWEQGRLQARFEHDSQIQYQVITQFFEQQVNLLHTLRDFYQASKSIDRQEFRRFAGPLMARSPGVDSLSWNPLVGWQQLSEFEQQMQQQGYAGFQINERDDRGRSVAVSQRDEYVVVASIEPRLANQHSLGYDLYSDPERKAVLELSRQTGRVSASRLQVGREGGDRSGLLLSLPVTMMDAADVAESLLRGYVISELRLDYLLRQLLDEGLPVGLEYRLSDVNSAVQGVWIGLSPNSSLQSDDWVFSQRFEFEFAERGWVMEVMAGPDYVSANHHLSAWLVVLLGLLVAVLVGGLATLLSGREQLLRGLLEQQSAALQEGGEQLRLTQFAMDHMTVGVYLIDQQAQLVYVNNAACRELGYQHDELIGIGLGELNPGFVHERWGDHWQRLKQEQSLQFETTHRTKKGDEITVEVIANYFEYDGAPYNLAFVRDVSSHQAYRDELRQLSAAIEQSPVSVVISDLDGVIEYVNSAFLRVTGYPREDVIGSTPRMLQSGYTTPQQYAEMWRVLRSGGSWFGEFCNKRKDGSLFWESASITPVLDDQGEPTHYLAVKEDITASRLDRERLRHSEQMLKRAQSLAHIGSWELDFVSGQLRWSDETCHIFGIAPGSSLDYQGYLDFVHPDDQERLDQAWLAALDGENYDIQHRIQVQGVIKTVHQRAEFEFDSQGDALRGVGTFHDITYRKQAEEALLQSEQRYRSLVTALSEGVVLRNADGRIEAFNPAARHIMGDALLLLQQHGPGYEGVKFYSESGELLDLADDPSMITLATGKPCRGVIVGLDQADGESVWLSINTEPLCDPGQQKPYAVVISFQDISHRRQIERELHQLATTDVLTGLLNRRASTQAIEQELALCRRLPSHQSALLLMDIDHFKSVNDRYGHAAGDQALVHLSDLIRSTRREIDMAGRWGGEEFVMLLPGTTIEGAAAYAERLRQQLAELPIEYQDAVIKMTVSIGLVLLDPQEGQFELALVRADKAMYHAKSSGRNRVVLGSEVPDVDASAPIGAELEQGPPAEQERS